MAYIYHGADTILELNGPHRLMAITQINRALENAELPLLGTAEDPE